MVAHNTNYREEQEELGGIETVQILVSQGESAGTFNSTETIEAIVAFTGAYSREVVIKELGNLISEPGSMAQIIAYAKQHLNMIIHAGNKEEIASVFAERATMGAIKDLESGRVPNTPSDIKSHIDSSILSVLSELREIFSKRGLQA